MQDLFFYKSLNFKIKIILSVLKIFQAKCKRQPLKCIAHFMNATSNTYFAYIRNITPTPRVKFVCMSIYEVTICDESPVFVKQLLPPLRLQVFYNIQQIKFGTSIGSLFFIRVSVKSITFDFLTIAQLFRSGACLCKLWQLNENR